jgi:hypothetical protein
VTGPSAEPLIVLDRVNKWFGSLHVLRDLNLSVGRGEVVVVVGPSGSGKSTLCRVINRLEPIDSGEIRVDGRPRPVEGRALARLRAEVGMVFQQFNLFAHRSVLDNVTLHGRDVLPGQLHPVAAGGPAGSAPAGLTGAGGGAGPDSALPLPFPLPLSPSSPPSPGPVAPTLPSTVD